LGKEEEELELKNKRKSWKKKQTEEEEKYEINSSQEIWRKYPALSSFTLQFSLCAQISYLINRSKG